MTTTTTLEGRASLGAGPLSNRYDGALAYAARHHRAQRRKGSQVPYLSHLMSVSALTLEHGGTEDQAIAGLLHDAVEDAETGQGPAVLREIGDRFGEPVRSMVAACSDSLNADEEGKEPWHVRKQEYVAGLGDRSQKSDEALLVTAADKIHNALSIARDLRAYGTEFWSTFNACPHDLLWYYTAVRDAVGARLEGHTIVAALHRAVDELIAAGGVDRKDIPNEPTAGDCPEHAGAGSAA
jgi:(p)ppGpp synthase/HD superfamily hydrolase